MSSTGVFEGRGRGAPLTERDRPQPQTPRGRLLLAAEDRAAALFSAHILRPAGIYGPGRELMIRKARAGEPIAYARMTNRIHAEDLIRVLRLLLTAPEAPAVLHAVDQRPAPLGEVVGYIAGLLGVDPPAPMAASAVDERSAAFASARLLSFCGDMRYPSYVEGYRAMLGDIRGAGA